MNKSIKMWIVGILVSMVFLSGCNKNDTGGTASSVTVTEGNREEMLGPNASLEGLEPLAPVYSEYTINIGVDLQVGEVKAIEKIKLKNQSGRRLEVIYLVMNLNAFAKDAAIVPVLDEDREDVYANGLSYAETTINSILVNNEETYYSIRDDINVRILLPEALENNEEMELTIEFESRVPKIAHKIGANAQSMWLGHYIPYLAVYGKNGYYLDKWYPVGHPYLAEAAVYNVTIETSNDYTVASTGTSQLIIDENSGMATTTVTTKLARDFAFAVGDYTVFETITTDGVQINFYAANATPAQAEKVIQAAVESIDYFNILVGTYPYQELDIVEADLYNSGTMAFSEFILIDSRILSKSSKIEREIALAVGHQWFYNIIGSDSYRQSWLSEGLVTYLELLYSYPDTIDEQMDNLYRDVQVAIDTAASAKLSDTTAHYLRDKDYKNIQYDKGALFFHAIRNKIGADNFEQVLKKYYTKYAYRIADETDFFATVHDVYDKQDLSTFFDQWLNYDEMPEM